MKKKPEPKVEPMDYHELVRPFESRKDMDAVFKAFHADLRDLQQKHRIANVICVLSAYARSEGHVGVYETTISLGDHNHVVPLLASALGLQRGLEYERMAVLRMDPLQRPRNEDTE